MKDPILHYGSIGVGPMGEHHRLMVHADPDGLVMVEVDYEEFDSHTKKWEVKNSISFSSIRVLEQVLDAARLVMSWDAASDEEG